MTGADAMPTLLVANRGEIACRVLRSARMLGMRTVAVFSDADADAPHVTMADAAFRLGPAPARDSYLAVDRVLHAADATGATLVHPGYGFLAENAAFATAVIEAGLTWVGPPPSAIEAMGDKAAAKRRMAEAGVPLLPGYQGEDASDDRLLAEAEAVGFPLMVKAAAGGGGKGMRLVRDAAELPEALAAARREAAGAFGDDMLILERALLAPRHVEIQVLADGHGTTLALAERDCSVQRRHQKVVEECPSPAVDAVLRARMTDAAVAAAEAVGYVGAGTVELLLDAPGDGPATFAFLEMNTRLQVEHPVTELAVRLGGEPLDLVAWQLRIAQGERLAHGQGDVTVHGHAIEVRLYAEDVDRGYLPQTGRVARWLPPGGDGVRVDAGIREGQQVTAHYDPMLAKVCAWGPDRDAARRRLARAVDETVLLGPTTNRAFLAEVLRSDAFAAGEATTALLADGPRVGPTGAPSVADVALAAAWWHRRRTADVVVPAPLVGWSNAPWAAARQRLRLVSPTDHVDVVDVAVHDGPDGRLRVTATREADDDQPDAAVGDARWHAVRGDRAVVEVERDGRATVVEADDDAGPPLPRLGALDGVAVEPWRLLLHHPAHDLELVDLVLAPPDGADEAGEGVLLAPMHGAVTAVHVAVGDAVDAGQPVVAIEAMKMEHVLRADVAGVVAEVAEVGAQVADRAVVARLTPRSGA